jgi:hypothetical protein
MIAVDTSKLESSLVNAEAEIRRKLLGMVEKFTLNFTQVAVNKTPIGDDITFRSLYDSREAPLPQEAGMSRANWNINEVDDFYPIYSTDQNLPYSDASRYMNSFYKLGETYYLGNATPYIRMLENNYSIQTQGQGIMEPILDQIMNVYQYNLDDYYKQS